MAQLAYQQGVQPIEIVDELLHPVAFDTDDELDGFLADLYSSGQADAA